MRRGKKFGIELILTEQEHKSLLARFDVNNAKLYPNKPRSVYKITRNCVLCSQYHNSETSGCAGCPMEIFDKLESELVGRGMLSCDKFIYHLLGSEFIRHCLLSYDYIFWYKENDVIAREGLQRIRKALLDMEKYKY